MAVADSPSVHLCECRPDCPAVVKTPGAHYARGHMPRDDNGRPIAGPRPVCRVCGHTDLGVPPVQLRNRASYNKTDNTYLCDDCAPRVREAAHPRCRGVGPHAVNHSTDAQLRALPSYDRATNTVLCRRCTLRGRRRAAIRGCVICNEPLKPQQDHCCSRACRIRRSWVKIGRHRTSKLAQFLFDRGLASTVSPGRYAVEIGVSRLTLRRLLTGGLPEQATLAALRLYFGTALPATETAEQRRHKIGVEAAARLFPNEGDWDRWREQHESTRVENLKGRKRHPEASRKTASALRAAGVYERARQRQQAFAAEQNGRALLSYASFHRWHPQATRAEIVNYAKIVAQRVGLGVKVVLAIWEEHGAPSSHAGGPKPLTERCRATQFRSAQGLRGRALALAVATDTAVSVVGCDDEARWLETFKKWRTQHHHIAACFEDETEGEITPQETAD